MKIYVLMLFLPLGCNLSDGAVSNLGQGEKQDTGPRGEDIIADIPGLLASDGSADVQDMNTVKDGGDLTDVASDLPTPPVVIQVAPFVDLDPLDSVHVFFDKEMNDESLTAEKVRFLTSASDGISTTLDYSPMPSDLQVAFQSRLNLLAAYRLTLDGAIEDLDGNNLEPGEWDIQTRDGQWKAETNIDRSRKKSFSPRVFVHEKYAMVVYRQLAPGSPTTTNLLASRYDWGTKKWSTSELLETNSGRVNIFKGEMDGTGNLTLVWTQRQDTLGSNLYQKRFTVDQRIWSKTTTIDNSANVADFDLEGAANGDVVAIWGHSLGGIWTSRFSLSKKAWSKKSELERRSIISKIKLGKDGNDNFIFTYLVRRQINMILVEYDLFARRYNAIAKTWENPFAIDNGSSNPSSTQLWINERGDATVIWINSKKVFVRQYNAANAVWGPPQGFGSQASFAPQIIASGTQFFFAFWIDSTTNKVLTSTFNGLDWSTAQALDSGRGMVESFTVEKASDGNLFLVSVQNEGTLKKVWATHFDLPNVQWMPAVQISAQPLINNDDSPVNVAVKGDREGNMMAFWRQSESGANLWSNRFDARQQSWKNGLKLNKNMGTVGEFSFDGDPFGRGIISFRQNKSGDQDVISKVFD